MAYNLTKFSLGESEGSMRWCWQVFSPTRKKTSYSDQIRHLFSLLPMKLNKLLSQNQKIETGENFSKGFLHSDFLGRGEPLCRHSTDCCFFSGPQWYNQVSSMVKNRNRKLFGSRRKKSECCSEDWHRWRFWSAFRHFVTQFAERFRMSKSSWMMDPTRSREMPSCSAIDVVFQD